MADSWFRKPPTPTDELPRCLNAHSHPHTRFLSKLLRRPKAYFFEERRLHSQVCGDYVKAEEMSVDSCSSHSHPIKVLVPLRSQLEKASAFLLCLSKQTNFCHDQSCPYLVALMNLLLLCYVGECVHMLDDLTHNYQQFDPHGLPAGFL